MSTVVGFHHVHLTCPPGGEDACRTFYGRLLGLTEIPEPSGLAGRGGIWFRGGPPNSEVEIHVGIEADFQPARRAHNRPVLRQNGQIRRWPSWCGRNPVGCA
ncbi:MAG TPA: hypothetical protein VIR27_07700 [Mycobacteriales bacterium]